MKAQYEQQIEIDVCTEQTCSNSMDQQNVKIIDKYMTYMKNMDQGEHRETSGATKQT